VPVRLVPLDVDPPDHRLFRRFLNDYFSRQDLLRYERQMRDIARQAIAGFIDQGEFEVVEDFSVPFSAGSLARIVFATDNQDLVDRGVAAVKRTALAGTPRRSKRSPCWLMEAMAEVAESATERMTCWPPRHGDVDGRPLTMAERLGVITLLLLGGLDTTRG